MKVMKASQGHLNKGLSPLLNIHAIVLIEYLNDKPSFVPNRAKQCHTVSLVWSSCCPTSELADDLVRWGSQ